LSRSCSATGPATSQARPSTSPAGWASTSRDARPIALRKLLTMTTGFGSAATDPFGDGGDDHRTTPIWALVGRSSRGDRRRRRSASHVCVRRPLL
jgi:CubicO group peptidase (beta-lactamase class C family)